MKHIKTYVQDWQQNLKTICRFLNTYKIHDIEDFMSDVLLKILENNKSFKDYPHLQKYMTLGVKSRVIDANRKLGSDTILTNTFKHYLEESNAGHENIKDLKHKLRKIKYTGKKAIIMRSYGFTYKEISDRLKINENCIRSKVHRCKQLIKTMS